MYHIGAEIGALMPYLAVIGGGLLVMLVDSFVRTLKKDHLSHLTVFVLCGAVILQIVGARPDGELLNGMLITSDYTRFFDVLFAGIGVVTTIYATGVFARDGRYRPEFYPLILWAIFGMMILVAANDLLSVFLGIETMSLATYILVGGIRGNIRSSEAGFKYLILGSFSSAFLLMGMALLYGFAGGTGFNDISVALQVAHPDRMLLGLGSGLVLIGLGFKIALVPFHMWTPDVYDGAPSYITGFMATAIKAAGFAVLIRFAVLMQPTLGFIWFSVLAVLTVLTMSVGNLVALAQSNIKRMLAWSSVAHAGYLMLGILAMISPSHFGASAMMEKQSVGEAAGSGILFYLIGYSLMNLAAFGVITALGKGRGEEALDINKYAGLSKRQPIAAATLAVIMLSLAGVPPMVGFMAKFYLFSVVVQVGLIPLAIIGVVNSLVSAYYYLRLIVVMYMKDADEDSYDGREPITVMMAAFLTVVVILLGVIPDSFHRLAETVFHQIQF